MIFEPVDQMALIWFIVCWFGYAFYANRISSNKVNIAKSLKQMRAHWISQLVGREVKIADVTSLGILQRTVTFFASTTIFILAGLLAVLGASDKAMQLASALPFVIEQSKAVWEMKVLLLIFVFIYAFFKFSWSVRQYNFCLVMFGAAPKEGSEAKQNYVAAANELMTTANNNFNYGLRAYNFAMAVIAWFVHPLLFMLASAWVVAVLYRREFMSRSLSAMASVNNALNDKRESS